MTPPVVSVVMANFRGAAHLARAMTSVLAQSERRLELILSDDASDDDSLAIARRIAATDDRVQVIAAPWREDLALRVAETLEQAGVAVAPRPET